MDSVFMKKGAFLFIMIRFIASGVEEYMILPTAWRYVQSLGENEMFLGITLASYGACWIIFTPFLSKLVDKYRCPKLVLLACHLLRTFGNAIYSISSWPYFALIGRILCGISAASDMVLLAELARTTTSKQRENVYFLLNGMYVFGCVFGPILATSLTFHFDIYNWKITSQNSPAFVMAVTWLVIFILTVFLPQNFCIDDDLSDDTRMVLTPNRFAGSNKVNNKTQILCLLSYVFFMWCFASVAGYYTPLLAEELFHLHQSHVNLMFLNALLFQLVLHLISYILRERLNERVLLLLAMLLQAIPLGIMAAFGFNWDSKFFYLLPLYIVIGSPLITFTLSSSLLSKITQPQMTMYYKHVVYMCAHLASVVARIFAAFFFTEALFAWFALQLGLLWVIITVSYGIVFLMQH